MNNELINNNNQDIIKSLLNSARAKLIGGCKEDEVEALEEFDRYTSRQRPYLVLIDGSLI
ncbi:hypothetical protein [Clostridium drakei]|uniref:Uncharacterized protein n=1 Tax=Clostridium drakei TaxID=332101 RepID=A0A2U8DLG7_9CLOT|nr:hypothetical protein [Clostridium drakei]AWI03529.1 hypothetical protein B9W14_03205 [Clostridium drakei]